MRAAGRMYSAHEQATRRDAPLEEVVGERSEVAASRGTQRSLTRRELLASASARNPARLWTPEQLETEALVAGYRHPGR